MKHCIFFIIFLSFVTFTTSYAHVPEFSTAGFFELPETGRKVYSMNPAWRFHKGHVENAELPIFDDSRWHLVSIPDGIELLPSEASGCINYQGEVWYRKHFPYNNAWKGKRLFVHFEGIMGKSKIWLNGQLMTSHFGGYLPIIIDVTDALSKDAENVLVVCADNSDDPSYPPGKTQDMLDFTYSGGIYRDCWLIAHNDVYITDPNYEDCKQGGGLLVEYQDVSSKSARVKLKTHIRNDRNKVFRGYLDFRIEDKNGNEVTTLSKPFKISSNKYASVINETILENPRLWSPENPHLYNLYVYIKADDGEIIDGYRQRIGVRNLEFKGKDGFWLNGEQYTSALIGANRHQDFAVIGNALSNSLHWRDAKKLRDAGMTVIRNAHYPQDPAFMDACDELGLFVIVNTPGWQFWSDAPQFAQRVYSDIRNMVRRDRNHASTWLWEPILNETWYPEDFAANAKGIIDEEAPVSSNYSACDMNARGNEYFKIHFTHPLNGDMQYRAKELNSNITYFTREWGDNVDTWDSHNSPSRVSRSWGEIPMLVQAKGYAKPDYPYTCYDALCRATPHHIGGCLWHAFDHQRGYHPDPFYGGIMDAYRQPKFSYYMFASQRQSKINPNLISESGPMVQIANSLTPFSPTDVTVFSNCDEVRLKCFGNDKIMSYQKPTSHEGMPSPIIVFKNAFNVMDDKELMRLGKNEDAYFLAEGLMDGKVVATHKVYPARRPSKINLWIDDEKTGLVADGSDIAVIVAEICDDRGTVKRLNESEIVFEVEGPAYLLGNTETATNPRKVHWGSAPILLRTMTQPGEIRVKAHVRWQGIHTPLSGEITIRSRNATTQCIVDEEELALAEKLQSLNTVTSSPSIETSAEDRKHSRQRLDEVSKQQTEFE